MERKRKKHRNGELDALYFDKLPQRAKEIFFDYFSMSFSSESYNKFDVVEVLNLEMSECESPIEIIFYLAYQLMEFSRKDVKKNISLLPQEEIILNNKYRVDFLYDSEQCGNTSCKPCKLVIECDGHNFHSSKKQIMHDNERDMDFKKAGYEIIHFSGSQIFEDPFKCANETIDYILSKIQ